jgi:hypothetical protein
MDPDPGGPKTYGYDGSGFESGSATLPQRLPFLNINYFRLIFMRVLYGIEVTK